MVPPLIFWSLQVHGSDRSHLYYDKIGEKREAVSDHITECFAWGLLSCDQILVCTKGDVLAILLDKNRQDSGSSLQVLKEDLRS